MKTPHDTLEDGVHGKAISAEMLFRKVGPLLGGTLLVVISTAMADTARTNSTLLVKAAILTALTVAAISLVPWEHVPAFVRAAPALSYLAVTFLVREATGGTESIYAQLVLVPILWLALYGTAIEVAVGVTAVAGVLVGPILFTSGSEAQWPRALLLTGTATVLGYGVQKLFSQLRAHSHRLIVLTRTDPLTGVGNRRAWDDELRDTLERAHQRQVPICVAMIDIDRFKEFNDERGHQAGDRLLKETTAMWRSQLRDGDTLARLGGDEFAVVLPGCSLGSARGILERLCRTLPAGQTCSTGVAVWDRVETSDEFIARADAALYRAKREGRNRVVCA